MIRTSAPRGPSLALALSVSLSFVVVILGLILFFCLKRRRQLRSAREENLEQRSATRYVNPIISPFVFPGEGARTNPTKSPLDLSPSDTSITYELPYLNNELPNSRETIPVALPAMPSPVRRSARSHSVLRLASRRSFSTRSASTDDLVSDVGVGQEQMNTLARGMEGDDQMSPLVSDAHPPGYTP